MSSDYWRRVRQRAMCKARTQLGLESLGSVVIRATVIIATITILSIWASDDAAMDEIISNAGIGALLFLVFPPVFFWYFFTTLPEMHAEVEERAANLEGEVKRLNDSQAKLRASIKGIAWGGRLPDLQNRIAYILLIRILNAGAVPSVAIDYKVTVRVGGSFIPMRGHHVDKLDLMMNGDLLRVTAGREDAIYVKTETPIPAGGMAEGHLVTTASEKDAMLITTGAQFCLSFSDVQGIQRTAEIIFDDKNQEMRYFSSIRVGDSA